MKNENVTGVTSVRRTSRSSTSKRRTPEALAELYAQAETMILQGFAEVAVAKATSLTLQKVYEIKVLAYEAGSLELGSRRAVTVRADSRFCRKVVEMLEAKAGSHLRLEVTSDGVMVTVALQSALPTLEKPETFKQPTQGT